MKNIFVEEPKTSFNPKSSLYEFVDSEEPSYLEQEQELPSYLNSKVRQTSPKRNELFSQTSLVQEQRLGLQSSTQIINDGTFQYVKHLLDDSSEEEEEEEKERESETNLQDFMDREEESEEEEKFSVDDFASEGHLLMEEQLRKEGHILHLQFDAEEKSRELLMNFAPGTIESLQQLKQRIQQASGNHAGQIH
eukprot:CAMPEP_0202980404 /NCGR_PEP_ID=MMETSP1396-20130829/86338_1 /ASSEMBLY_ACC=CAM_ASM_000872 /TAXON_ID= /ORGANISM="Pseudokeronopsis sp., Strain Brazil" /LENGTH=192 /DNA_ID=CAMNT_0049720369 /DNA_START=783 /DNA_END=1361 /DNA_ORIENTATION=-